jgi:hypothetical protein
MLEFGLQDVLWVFGAKLSQNVRELITVIVLVTRTHAQIEPYVSFKQDRVLRDDG